MVGKSNLNYRLVLLKLSLEMLAATNGMMRFLPWQDEQGTAGRHDNWSSWQFQNKSKDSSFC